MKELKDCNCVEGRENVLFVCSQGADRSPRAAALFDGSEKYNAKYAGVGPMAAVEVNSIMINWADVIIVMFNFVEPAGSVVSFATSGFQL